MKRILKPKEPSSVEIIEEEWSHLLNNEDGEGSCFRSFAPHNETVSIPLEIVGKTMVLSAMTTLTPIDMMGLCTGNFDSTGNRVWMGAHMFIRSLFSNTNGQVDVDDEKTKPNNYLLGLFGRRRILELGCGTGCSGLSLLLLRNGGIVEPPPPSFVLFTDADESVLSLCRKNCRVNLGLGTSGCDNHNHNNNCNVSNEDCDYNVRHLAWGKDNYPSDLGSSFQSVLATDVIYDSSMIEPLFATAAMALVPHGHFVLSHIPRAHVDDESHKDQMMRMMDTHIEMSINKRRKESRLHTVLEWLIHEKAKCAHFKLTKVIRPRDFMTHTCGIGKVVEEENNEFASWSDLNDVGAAIFVFQKMK